MKNKHVSQEEDLFSTPEEKLIYKKDLISVNNIKVILREIKDYFAGNVTGITRNEKIAENLMRILFCKIFDEKYTKSNEVVEFSRKPNEVSNMLKKRILVLFDKVKNKYADLFDKDETIEIDSDTLSYIVSKLETISISNAERDIVADAFEELIGTSFRGDEGQFFTPRNVVQMMIDILKPKSGERILDPACGSGGFLSFVLRDLLKNNQKNIDIVGIDKDRFLSKVSNIYLSLIEEGNHNIFCENSLERPMNWSKKAQDDLKFESFDLILTNPPFGAKIPVVGEELLKQFQLGHDWYDKDDLWQITKNVMEKQPPQVLFIERCMQFLKKGGRMGIVLPEGVFGNPSDRYIWEYIKQNASIIGIVSLAQETFQPSTHTKTSVLFIEKNSIKNNKIFMAVTDKIGHNKNGKEIYKINKDGSVIEDKNGNKTIDDDLPLVSRSYNRIVNEKMKSLDRLGFLVDSKEIKNHIYIPEYYNPEIILELKRLENSKKYNLVTIGSLLDDDVVEIRRGNEIGSHFYGTGDIPFVRTTDIVNWEIKTDPIKAVAEEIYLQYREAQDIKENDILFVNDGTFLIGRTAIVTRSDIRIILQSHLKKIRVKENNLHLNPFYLLFLLNSQIVKRQISSKTFVQATISSIGNRLKEVVLPVTKDSLEIRKITQEVKGIIDEKANLRERVLKLMIDKP